MAKPRVFISSTYYDLKYIRASLDLFIDKVSKGNNNVKKRLKEVLLDNFGARQDFNESRTILNLNHVRKLPTK